MATAPPLSGMDVGTDFQIVGRAKDPEHGMQALMTGVSGNYAHVFGTAVLRGRMINDDDAGTAPYVIVINDALARAYFPGTNPIGKQIDFTGDRGMPKPYTIVGVIADQVHSSLSEQTRPLLMLPFQQIPPASLYYPILVGTAMNFVVKTPSSMLLAPLVRSAFKEVAPDYALDSFRAMQEVVNENSSNQRIGLYLVGAFAGLAVLLVVAGLYGVLSQITGYRHHEFGIRLALGATPSEIRWLVLRQALTFVSAGLAGGMAVVFGAGGVIRSFLYNVSPFDVTTMIAVGVLLLVIGCATAAMPAGRSAAIDPMRTLRGE